MSEKIYNLLAEKEKLRAKYKRILKSGYLNINQKSYLAFDLLGLKSDILNIKIFNEFNLKHRTN